MIPGIRLVLVQAGPGETDRGCHPARASSHSEVNAAGKEDEEEKRTDTSGGEGHRGRSRELWVMSNRETRFMWSLIPDGNRIGLGE